MFLVVLVDTVPYNWVAWSGLVDFLTYPAGLTFDWMIDVPFGSTEACLKAVLTEGLAPELMGLLLWILYVRVYYYKH